jgi:hypothetical protein
MSLQVNLNTVIRGLILKDDMDVNHHGANSCSVAGIHNDFSGALHLRAILQQLLRRTATVCAAIQRPFCEIIMSPAAISNISAQAEELRYDDDLFSLSFVYQVSSDNEGFTDAFVRIWREYEQPVFLFYEAKLSSDTCGEVLTESDMSWGRKIDILFSLSPCYALYRSIEEDVVWIDKNERLSFDNLDFAPAA